MKRNFDSLLSSFDGTPIKDGLDKIKRLADGRPEFDPKTGDVIVLEKAKDATLRTVSLGALGAAIEGDDRMDGERKYGLYRLAGRIDKGGLVEITTEELAMLKQRIARTYANIIVIGAAFDLLEADFEAPVNSDS